MALTEVIARGAWGTVECVIRLAGDAPALDFIKGDLNQREMAAVLEIFQKMANYGEVPPKQFKSEMNGLSAFRHERQSRLIRFPCFRDSNRWILTHGFFKPGAKKGRGKWPTAEINRATESRASYFARKSASEHQ